MITDRQEAGHRLIEPLRRYERDPAALVLALPRGGVVVAAEIASALKIPLDVFIVRKLGAPGNPEFAIGAITETGTVFLNQQAVTQMNLSRTDVESLVARQQQQIAVQQSTYRAGRRLPSLADRIVIVVDDGIATGATLFAAIQAVRVLYAKRVIAAIPVGPKESIQRIRQEVDELIVLEEPEEFYAVGQHYLLFDQVTDQEVVESLRRVERSSQSETE